MKWMAGILLAKLRGVVVGSNPVQRHSHSKRRAEYVALGGKGRTILKLGK